MHFEWSILTGIIFLQVSNIFKPFGLSIEKVNSGKLPSFRKQTNPSRHSLPIDYYCETLLCESILPYL